jgi:hypothetical protein
MNPARFRRTWRELGLQFTPAKLVRGIQVRAERIMQQQTDLFLEIEALRDSLKELPSAKPLFITVSRNAPNPARRARSGSAP